MLIARVSERKAVFNAFLFSHSIPARTSNGREVRIAGGNPHIKELLVRGDDPNQRLTWYPEGEIVVPEQDQRQLLAVAMRRAEEVIRS